MEKGTMVGLGVTLFGVFVSAIMHGIQPVFLFMEFGSLIIVFGGCFGATITSFPFAATQNLGKYIQKAMKGPKMQALFAKAEMWGPELPSVEASKAWYDGAMESFIRTANEAAPLAAKEGKK